MKLRDFRKQLRDWPPLYTTEGDTRIHHAREPGPARIIATSLDERAGANGVPGEDCSAIQVCPRVDTRDPSSPIHRGCVVTSLGRSLGTLFSRYYQPEASASPVLKATFWETYRYAVHIMDPHDSARLVEIGAIPSPAEYETITDVRDLRVMTACKEFGKRTKSVFNLYPAEVNVCGCESPWDGARADCSVCHGLGMVWRLRLHPMLLPERGSVEALERTALRIKGE